MRRRALKRLPVFCAKSYPISIASLPITTFSAGSVSAVYDNDVRGIHKETDRGFEQIDVLLYYWRRRAAFAGDQLLSNVLLHSIRPRVVTTTICIDRNERSTFGLTFGLLRGRIGYSRHSGCCC